GPRAGGAAAAGPRPLRARRPQPQRARARARVARPACATLRGRGRRLRLAPGGTPLRPPLTGTATAESHTPPRWVGLVARLRRGRRYRAATRRCDTPRADSRADFSTE